MRSNGRRSKQRASLPECARDEVGADTNKHHETLNNTYHQTTKAAYPFSLFAVLTKQQTKQNKKNYSTMAVLVSVSIS